LPKSVFSPGEWRPDSLFLPPQEILMTPSRHDGGFQ
jgi:hypothetical protein